MGPEGRAQMGVGEGMLRINVGLEDPLDVIEDLEQAFDKAGV
jgi:cystathionine gamma-synthase/O-succinylhomoserine sulfhydrylase